MPYDDRPPRLARAMLKRFVLAGLLILAMTATATATYGLETVGSVAHDLALGGAQIKSTALTAAQAGAPQTILVIGSDRRALSKTLVDRLNPARTDSIVLVRMDPVQGQTSVLSIPRDLRVDFQSPKGYLRNQKINAAYAVGGAPLAVQVIKQTLPGLTINHVVDLNFGSFRRVVDAIGCVYVDVDRRYFNANLGTPDTNFASINIQPGYQRLCGQPALDYVRYRHTDSDFVRAARQQDFIRQAKEQVGVSGLLNNFGEISTAFGKAIRTDIRGTNVVLRLIELAAFSTGKPVRQVHFQATSADANINGGSYVTSTPQLIRKTVADFLYGTQRVHLSGPPRPTPLIRGHHRIRRSNAASPFGLYPILQGENDVMIKSVAMMPFRAQLPGLQTAEATAGGPRDVRAYALRDEHGHLHHGYRVDWQQSVLGGYYGIEGMNWTDPPLFAHPTETRKIGGRAYLLVEDGGRVHDVGFRAGGALFWVSNTWLEDLSGDQMLAIAQSMRPAH